MRTILLCSLALAACSANVDRLTEEQAAADQAAANRAAADQDAAIGSPPASEPPPLSAGAVTSAPPTGTYKAVGTEPGWALTVRGGTMAYQGDYGAITITEATPAAFRAAPGTYAGKRLKLIVTAGPCSDGMSDLVYRHSVRLVADGKAVAGCGGGTVSPADLAGTSWNVSAINGRATPGGAGYFLAFTGTELSARFGCNSIGGRYQVNGDHLSASDLTQTEMACAGPEMMFEAHGTKLLSSNMRIERASGERMRLVSEAGSIDLRRSI